MLSNIVRRSLGTPRRRIPISISTPILEFLQRHPIPKPSIIPKPGRNRRRLATTTLVCLLAAGFADCTGSDFNFSQYPGFAEWYACNPPRDAIPDSGEQALLHRFRPRFFLSDESEGPIDFYHDYIAEGRLTDEKGKVISDAVDQRILNAHRRRPGVVFTHRPAGKPARMAVYGRIEKAVVPFDDTPWQFLSYTLVFRHSGLPAGIPAPVALFLDLAGRLEDWHQLDHYIDVTLALDARQQPRAAIFQQHNYARSYILADAGGNGRLRLAPDGRVGVDVAIWSNELYPHRPERLHRRAVGYMNPDTVPWLVLGQSKPLLAADDVTDPAREIDPPLRFLPPSDAFYTFHGRLGERRQLPGTDGPPGADYNTFPTFKPPAVRMIAFHWWDGDTLYHDILQRISLRAVQPGDVEFFDPLVRRFTKILAEDRAENRTGSRDEDRDSALRMASQTGLVGSENTIKTGVIRKWAGC